MRTKSTFGWRGKRRAFARRLGGATLYIVSGVLGSAVLAVAGALVWSGQDDPLPDLVTTAAWKGPYDFAIVEQGSVESGSSTEIRCDVRARGGVINILEVVPEGTVVKPGDVVCKLDSSGLEIEENSQRVFLASREAQLAQAENTLNAARIARTEYLEGLFVSQEMQLESALFAAERLKETAQTGFESAKVLHAEAIFTTAQVEAAQSNLEQATNNFIAAETALNTLRKLTKLKELALLDASIASADASVQAQRRSLRVENDRLEFIQQQIKNCTLRAPAAGQVVYANETDPYRSSSQSQFVVSPGSPVRERQVILWLPNPRDMQVKATVNEARITLMRPGLPVTVRVTALGDDLLEGHVVRVNQFAEPSQSSTGNIKRYGTIVKIKDPPTDLRVGMNAEVRIHVEQVPSAVQVPVQALAESRGRYFSLVKEGENYETREVHIGSTNDKVATIATGLEEGDEVVMNPRQAEGLLELPEMAEAYGSRDGVRRASVTDAE